MNCQDINQNIFDYCDGLISPDLQSLIADHLNKCESCRKNYQLTILENEALSDTKDIPPLSAAFTALVINSIASANIVDPQPPQYLVMSKRSSPGFKKSSWYKGLAMLAAVITLCLYLPNYKQPVNNSINTVADNANKQEQIVNKPIDINLKGTTALDKNDNTFKISQVDPKPAAIMNQKELSIRILEDGSKSASVTKNTPADSPVLSAPESTEIPNRTTAIGVGRSIRGETQVSDAPIQSFSLQNVPTRFKLKTLDNTIAQEPVYNYVSIDGKETFQLRVTPSNLKIMATKAISNTAYQDSNPLTKDIEVAGQVMTLTISGNIPTEELTQMINTIELKDDSSNPIKFNPTEQTNSTNPTNPPGPIETK